MNIKNSEYNKLFNRAISNERGTALVVSLLMLVIMTAIGITATNRTIVEGWLSANYRSLKQAFYVAEAGLEFTRNALRADADWSNNTTAPGGTITVGGRGGSYTITIVGTPQRDSITVRSTGTIAGATSVVEALIERGNMLFPPGAVSLVGNDEIDVDFSGNSFRIDGMDYRMGDREDRPTGTNPARLGISVSDNRIIDDIDIEGNQRDNITGTGSPPSIGVSAALTSAMVSDFVSVIKGLANPDFANPNNWTKTIGTVAAPEIVYVNVTGNSEVKISGNTTGTGILIINIQDDGAFSFTGNVSWTGLVIVTGRDAEISFRGGGARNNIMGGLIVHGNNINDTDKELDIRGNIKMLYSQEALDIARRTMPATVSSWRQVHN